MSYISRPDPKDTCSGRKAKNAIRGILFMAIIFVALLFDVLVFRPRESTSKYDREVLVQELQHIVAVTSMYGSWENGFVFFKSSGGSASKYFTPRQGREEALTLLTEALLNFGWKPYLPTAKSAMITLCKGRYRVSLEWLDATKNMGTSFTVKEFEKDRDCS